MTVTNLATEGTPAELSTNSMYGPGGAAVPFAGAVTFRLLPLVAENDSSIERWSMFRECVVELGRIRTTFWIEAACGVETLKWLP